MSDTTNKTAAKLPSHTAYQVRDRKNGKPIWTRIGAAWTHADGKGFNIQIECVPLDGRSASAWLRTTLRTPASSTNRAGREGPPPSFNFRRLP